MKPDARRNPDQPFEGGAFHPNLPDGRASGSLRFDFPMVRFESDKGKVELPLDGLKLALGGANDRLIFLTHPSHPQVTIHTADHTLLEHPVVLQTPALAAQRAQVRTKKRTAAAVLLSVVALLVAGTVALVLSRDWLVKAAASTVPVSWEIKAGDKLYDQIVRSKRAIDEPALVTQLKAITDPLVGAVEDKRYPLTFHIVEDATLNAFAVPGGHVVLHTGLLLAADAPEEVAGVLAHEIAHVTRRHSMRNILSSAGLYLIISSLFGDVSGIIGVIADNSAFLLDRKFSRDFEREADEVGWDYLIEANVAPNGMIAFFKKMRDEEKKMMDKLPVGGAESALEVLSTHPATAERIERLEAKWSRARQDGYRNISLNYAEFKTSLRAKLHSSQRDK